ncbi:acyltransferase [Rhodococcus sp. P1Y]|uniref:acyltransferase n=1 Tax=Rhodococcus sp. P1Y TaxID=1302308 RepID=UPI000EB583BE|nr:acyltransferase [Rhodococcus sp. P1Y]AYJ48084.1 acyltransferase [Rhodococcus sp. P1Y]
MIDGYTTSRRLQFGERIFNWAITHVPSHWVRQKFLRTFGATIGTNTSIMMGTTILGLNRLVIGNNCSIGFDCVLDSRGGLTIDDDVVLASDVQIITGHHLVHSDDFAIKLEPTHIEHHVWVASRSTVLQGLTIGAGAVVGASSLLRDSVKDMDIVAGIPAKVVGQRVSTLDYHPIFRPMLY